MSEAIVAIDAGTSSVKALLVDVPSGAVLARASAPLALHTPRPGWVEQDAGELMDAVDSAAGEVLQRRPDATVLGIAISNQRESVVAWDSLTGEPVGPLLSWQDARMTEFVAGFDDDVRHLVRQRTGLTLDAMFSAPKMRWLLDKAAGQDVQLGTVDSWIVHNLTGSWSIEAGNASRTLLLDLATGTWDDELLEVFGIPRSALPEVSPSDADLGVTRGRRAIPDGVPILSVLADSHAALYAQGTDTPGVGKATYGTGTSVMIPLAALAPPAQGIDTTIAWWTSGPTYAREGNILATGQALDWTARLLAAEDSRSGGEILGELAHGTQDSGGVTLVPAFTGLGAPHWDRAATAILSGMSATTTPAQVARAAFECVAHQVTDLVEAMTADGHVTLHQVHADGGASTSDLLMSVQADLLGLPVARARESALSPLGAAHLAARRLGTPLPPVDRDQPTPPTMSPAVRQQVRTHWRVAVARSRFTPTHPEENA
ncbi:MAG: FGGY family carbohydrate kinase [Candidatus Nanopelagicales bacterium]